MRMTLVALSLAMAAVSTGVSAQPATAPREVQQTQQDRDLIQLSRQKWLWMAERNNAALDKLFHDKAVFVHMSRTLSKADELGVIASGNIQYKQADIKQISVRFVGDTAIVLSTIELFAIVRDAEARNPFVVTEAYVKTPAGWQLASLAFTRTTTPAS